MVRRLEVVIPTDAYDALVIMAGDGRSVGRLARDLILRGVDDLACR